uniref:Histidinol-phosphate transaminase n=1 Tax=Roseihalotalea indica TaxID=2867963 RepID=A0AA49JG28_9BACT|nr:histidinol-phosphate transaminase [Tunicatimonas sp. TK19036]
MSSSLSRRHWLKSTALLTGLAAVHNPFEAFTATAPTHYFQPPGKSPWDYENMKARLTSNENPFGPSPKAQEVMCSAIKDSWMYPKLGKDALKKELADLWGVTEDHIILGAGSTEILMAAAQSFGKHNHSLLAADLTYMSLIRRACDDYQAGLTTVPLTADYDYDFDQMLDNITDDTSLVYICNPNNPTGRITDASKLQEFCKLASKKKPVFIDEAYIDYQEDAPAHSMIHLVREGYPVMIARTFSKVHAMAGMRIGYCVATPELINELGKYGTDGNGMSRPAVLGALATLEDAEFMDYSRKMNAESKAFLYKTLEANGYEYIPSDTNFVLFPIRMDGDRFVMEMMKRGVGLKRVVYRNQHYCRVSIGTMANMETFAGAFGEIS